MKFQKIREARKAANITQEELAQILGVNRATVSKYETGGIDVPTSQLKAIADALGVLMVDLLDENTSKIYNAGFVDGAVAESMENDTIDKLWKEEGYSGSDIEVQLINAFSHLNEKGQQIAVERVEELTKILDYQRGEDPPKSASEPTENK